MRGSSRAHLMEDSDAQLWVVKFKNNPHGRRVLASELLAGRLANRVGLTVPECDKVHVSERLIQETPDLVMRFEGLEEPCEPGWQLGSRYIGEGMVAPVRNCIDLKQLCSAENLKEFAGMLAFDKWTENIDGREVLFVRNNLRKRYTAVFVDHGHCFHAGRWCFEDVPLRGAYARNEPYAKVNGWPSFEPWLGRIEHLHPDVVREIAGSIPEEWYYGRLSELNELVRLLLERRGGVRRLIQEFGNSERIPFPLWIRKRGSLDQDEWNRRAASASSSLVQWR